MQDLKVAIVQLSQYWEDKKLNLEMFSKRLKHGVSSEVDLILLPEMFNTSFSMNVENLAEEMDGEGISWLKETAKEFKSIVGASLIIKEGANYYNRFVMVSENGVESHYDKRHLFRMADENKHFTAGEKRVVFKYKGWNILLQVCYDLRFPVFSRNRTIEGSKEYDAVIYVANWPEKRNMVWKNLIQARAIENQAYCIGVNRVGMDGNNISYSGDSMLVDPWGNIEYQFSENKEEVKILTLQTATIEAITRLFPAFKDAD
jgi:predicted amidohydrolase